MPHSARNRIPVDIALVRGVLAKEFSERNKLLFEVLYETGCKVKELVSIRSKDLRNQSIYFSDRSVRISKELYEALKKFSKGDYLFSSRQSLHISPRRVEQLFKALSNKIGQQIKPKDLRSFKLKELIKDPKQAKIQLGLKSIRELKLKSFSLNTLNRIPFKSDLHKALFWVIYETAIKLNELVEIKIKDINFKNNTIIIDNDRYPRVVRISNELKELLANLGKSQTDYLFRSRQSKKITPRRVQQIFRAYSHYTNGLTPRELRLVAIKNLVERSSDYEIKEILGLRHLNVYTHGNIGYIEEDWKNKTKRIT